MSCDATNISISPVNVYWQMEASEQIDFTDSSASSFGGKYFTLYGVDGTGYYVWGDENNTDSDPAPSGLTAIEVDYAASASASAIATAAATAIGSVSGFSATASGAVVTVLRSAVGEVTDASEGTTTDVVVTICRRGKNLDLGLLQGDLELNISPSNFIVNAHQTGLTPRAALFQGWEEVTVTTTLLETTNSKLKALYKVYGGSFTPSGGTEVFGVGSNRQGQNLLKDAGRLVLRPVNAADNTTDTSLMLAIPVPDTLVFSGENPKTLSVTWQGFVDTSIDSRTSVLLFGDETQDVGA